VRVWIPTALVVLAGAAPALAQSYGSGGAEAAASDEQPLDETGRSLGSYSIDDRTAKYLQEALVALTEDRVDDAEAALGSLRERSLNPLERQRAHEVRANIAYTRGDHAQAREHFESAIAQGQMSPSQRADIRFQIAQLYMADEMWPEVIANLKTWFAMAKDPSPAAYYMLGVAYLQNDDLEGALEPARRAVDATLEPQESWLKLLLSVHLRKKDHAAAVPVLEELVRRFPSRTYWLSLSTLHGALGDYQKSLVPLQLAYTQGYLTEGSDLRRLAQLLLFLGLPYRAARVIEDGTAKGVIQPDAEVYELLGNSWIAAREYDRTVEPLTRAAELSADGDLFVRLAQVHIQREKWVAAAQALQRAIELGDLQKPGDAKLLMGIAFYNSERPAQAQSWFSQAQAHEETRNEAQQWLLHIEREQQKQSG